MSKSTENVRDLKNVENIYYRNWSVHGHCISYDLIHEYAEQLYI